MPCNCKHNKEVIDEGYAVITELRKLFIKRMTVDSKTHDARRREFNQAIFFDYGDGEHIPCFNGITMEMVLQCFDNAIYDWRRTFCDIPNCYKK